MGDGSALPNAGLLLLQSGNLSAGRFPWFVAGWQPPIVEGIFVRVAALLCGKCEEVPEFLSIGQRLYFLPIQLAAVEPDILERQILDA